MRRARCNTCGEQVPVRRNGLLRMHRRLYVRRYPLTPIFEACEGSANPPGANTATTEPTP